MNPSTLLGALFGTIVLAVAILTETQDAFVFWNPPGFAIVAGGVVAASFICYPLAEVLRAFRAVGNVLRREDLPVVQAIDSLKQVAENAMATGTYRLDQELQAAENLFLKDCLRMVVDSMHPDRMRKVMETTILETKRAALAEAAIFRNMSKMAPAFGMVGTLIGLIVMFKGMGGTAHAGGNPMAELAGHMAIALTATFYGVILANLVFLPIAIKLERRVAQRVNLMRVIMEGSLLLARRTPPELIVDELKAFIPQRQWKDVSAAKRGPGVAHA